MSTRIGTPGILAHLHDTWIAVMAGVRTASTAAYS